MDGDVLIDARARYDPGYGRNDTALVARDHREGSSFSNTRGHDRFGRRRRKDKLLISST